MCDRIAILLRRWVAGFTSRSMPNLASSILLEVFYSLDDFARLVHEFFVKSLDLLAAGRLHVQPRFIDFGDQVGVSQGFGVRFTQNFSDPQTRQGRYHRPAKFISGEDNAPTAGRHHELEDGRNVRQARVALGSRLHEMTVKTSVAK